MEPIVEEEEEVAPNIQEENKEKETSETQNPTNNNDKNDKTNSDQGIVCDTGMVWVMNILTLGQTKCNQSK